MKCQKATKEIFQTNKSLVVGHTYGLHRFSLYLIYLFSVEYVGLTPGSEREIFQRVQLGMTLTAAGKFVGYFDLWTKFSRF